MNEGERALAQFQWRAFQRPQGTRDLGLMVIAGLALAAQAFGAAVEVPVDADSRALSRALCAYQGGQLAELHSLLQPILESASAERLAAAEAYLRDQGLDAPIAEILVRARAWLALDRPDAKLPLPGRLELPLVLLDFSNGIDTLLEPIRTELAIGFRVDMPHEVIDAKVETYVGMLEQLHQAEALQSYLKTLSHRLNEAELAQLPVAARQVAQQDVRQQRQANEEMADQLIEHLVELCLVRNEDMLAVLDDDRARYEERLRAAGRVGQSLETLDRYWQHYARRKIRAPSSTPTSKAEQLRRSQARRFRSTAGGLALKAFHLVQAQAWWLRGRYGRGPIENGRCQLALPHGRGARKLPFCLRVSMPRQFGPVLDPLDHPRETPLARRHLSGWLVDRMQPVAPAWSGESWVLPMLQEIAPETPGPRSRSAKVAPKLDMIDPPAVGYLEYQMTLFHCDRLFELTNAGEQQLLMQLPARDDRLVVHSCLSRKYDPRTPASELRLGVPAVQEAGALGPFERRGLVWMTALARVELGAMLVRATAQRQLRDLVTTSTTPDPEILDPDATVRRRAARVELEFRRRGGRGKGVLGPFDLWPPTAADENAYAEILWDGARQHYYALREQLLLRQAVPLFSDARRLADLLTRVVLVAEMIDAYQARFGRLLTPAQKAELTQWRNWLAAQRESLLPLYCQAVVHVADQ